MISFFNGASPFSGVCPFHFYDICNEQKSDSACVYGKISVLFMISVTNLHFSEIKGTGPKPSIVDIIHLYLHIVV